MILGALEAGGTKMVVAVGDENGKLLDKSVFPTTDPQFTVDMMIGYFEAFGIEGLGIGSFGPIDLNKNSATYGQILNSPKRQWCNFNMVKPFEQELKIKVALDTDVDAALLGELKYGAARGCKNAVYMTVGTGIGAGIYSEGKIVHGVMHSEAGHVLIQRLPGDNAKSSCPCHDNCLEGLASGPAIKLAFGKPAEEIADNAEMLKRESYYIGQSIANYMCMLAPEKIILGGGVMQIPGLIDLIREEAVKALGGYLSLDVLKNPEKLIVLPECNGDQGILGALELAKAGMNMV